MEIDKDRIVERVKKGPVADEIESRLRSEVPDAVVEQYADGYVSVIPKRGQALETGRVVRRIADEYDADVHETGVTTQFEIIL